MKKFSVTMATGLMVFAMSITGCGGSSQEVSDVSESASDGYTEVTIDNFDMEQTFTKAPERVVSLSYSETEILTGTNKYRLSWAGLGSNFVLKCFSIA